MSLRSRLRGGGLAPNAMRSVGAHMVHLAVSFLTVAILPLATSVEIFGLWNLYTLLASFVYLLSFGLNDGILLRLGGKRPEELDWALLFRFFSLLATVTFIFGLGLAAVLSSLTAVPLTVVFGLAISIPLLILTSFLGYVLVATNQITRYAWSIVSGRGVFIGLFLLLLVDGPTVGSLILADLVAKAISLVYVIWACRSLFKARGTSVPGSVVRKELSATVRAGMVLMVAGVSSMAADGVVRLIVQGEWGIAVFAGLSLALSAAHLVTSFVKAVATVVFPWLRRVDQDQARRLFGRMYSLICVLSVVVLACFFPMRSLIAAVFPEFEQSSELLFIVFPVVVCQARVALLVTPFLNSLRRERMLLCVNVVGLAISTVLAVFFAYVMHHLVLTVTSMLAGQAVRMVVGEMVVRRAIGLAWVKPVVLDALGVTIFMACAFAPALWGAIGFALLSVAVTVFLLLGERRRRSTSVS